MIKVTKQPELHNEEIEKEINAFATDQSKERMVKIMQGLSGALILQPAIFPEGTKPEDLKKAAQGDMENGAKPQPIVLKNKDGQNFFPIFTSKQHLQPNQQYPAMLFLPFMECVKMAARPELNLEGIVVNPFTNNMILHQPAINMILGSQQTQTVTMSGPQMQVFLRNQIEMTELPKKLYTEKEAFMQVLTTEKEGYLLKLYHEMYGKVKGLENACPYTEKDFEMMSLNISDTMQLVQISMPEQLRSVGQCVSVFLFLNPQSGDAIYYTIKQAEPEQENTLGSVSADGSYTELGAAPQDGSELYTLMDMVPWKKESAEV